MQKRTKVQLVFNHMFSKKALGYRAFTVTWTMIAVMFWNWIYFQKLVFIESLEVTLTIVAGKFLFYGIWEYFHLTEVDLKAVYDDESLERVDAVIALRDEEGHFHDPELEDISPPRKR